MKNAKDHTAISPDDPRLTAYALGELDEEERTAVEALLAHDGAARETIAAIRALAGAMTDALEAEPTTAAPPKQVFDAVRHAAIVSGRDPGKLDGGDYRTSPNLIRFPQFYYVVSGLAAACFVVFMLVRTPEPPRPPKKFYQQIPLTAVQLPVATSPENSPASVAGDAMTSIETENSLLGKTELPEFSVSEKAGIEKSTRTIVTSTDGVGKMAIQPAAFSVGSGRVYLYPQDDKFVITPRVRLPRFGGFEARPRDKFPIVPLTKFDQTLAANDLDLFNFGVGPRWPRHGLLAAGDGMNFAALGDVRRPDELAPVPELLRAAPSTEMYAYVHDNDFVGAAQNPFSTFSIDVDTAGYANVRRFLHNGQRPPAEAVKIEELVNYFPYRYAPPAATGAPIAVHLEVAESPWSVGHRLVRIGLKGREIAAAERGAANLVFLIDVSASMNEPNKLSLVKESMHLLVGKLRPDDRVAIVTYAGSSELAFPSTPVARAHDILAALDGLTPGGSTNGAMGIELAYDIAKANFVPGGVNRVVLCTDGDFNVGATSENELTRLVGEKAKSGVFLTALGFGMGNLKDATLEKLAEKGNGNYGYIDSRREAEKLLVQQVDGTLLTIAKDVKIRVDFNAARVASYRLIGYENRLLKKEDFNHDQADAGEIGAGHSVTALYEIIPVGVDVAGNGSAEKSKYAAVQTSSPLTAVESGELLTVKVRYKETNGDVSQELEFPLTDAGGAFAAASPDFKFAAAVASFGMVLKNSPYKGDATFDQISTWAAAGMSDDAGGWRSEFAELIKLAKVI